MKGFEAIGGLQHEISSGTSGTYMLRGPLQKLLSRSRYDKQNKYVFCTRSKESSS